MKIRKHGWVNLKRATSFHKITVVVTGFKFISFCGPGTGSNVFTKNIKYLKLIIKKRQIDNYLRTSIYLKTRRQEKIYECAGHDICEEG